MAEATGVARGPIDDDDTISVTSTVSEVFSETREFEVERVVAERAFQGEKRFLISWYGYPEWLSTWEPKENIQDDAILEAWDRRKQLEEEKEIPSFDIEAFEATVGKKAEEKLDGHRRRKAKRKRQGMSVSSSEDGYDSSSAPLDDSDSSVEAVEENEHPEDDPGMRVTKTKQSRGFAKPIGNALSRVWPPPNPYLGTARPTAVPDTKNKRRRSSDSHDADTPIAVKRARSDKSQRPSKGSSVPSRADGTRGFPSSKTSSASMGSSLSREDLSKLGTMRGRPSTGNASSSRGQTATRGGMAPQKPRKLIVTSSDPKHYPKLFPTMRIRRKAELQARQIADGPPDLEALGGLFDPSKPSTYKALKPAGKLQLRTQDSDDEEDLFVDQNEPTVSHAQVEPQPSNGSWKEIPYQPPSKSTPIKSDMTTCFFWYKNHNDPKQKGCIKGDENCKRLHYLQPGIPIASPPAGYVERSHENPKVSRSEQQAEEKSATHNSSSASQRLVCFFWHRKEILGKGSGCSYAESHDGFLHDWYDNAVVAASPPGYSERDEVESWRPPKGFHHEHDPPAAFPQKGNSSSHQNDGHPSFDPSNPNHATCWFYDRGINTPSEGGCRKGKKCKYLHFHAPGLRIARPTALMLEHSNNRVSTDSLPLHQPEPPRPRGPSRSRASYSEDIGFNAICYDWFDTGRCPVRSSCQFIHVNDPYAPVAPKQIQTRSDPEPSQLSEGEKQRRARAIPQSTKASLIPVTARATYRYYLTCRYWDLNGHCRKGDMCKYLHAYEDGIPIAPAPYCSLTCKFWLRGDCYKTAEECEFAHSMPAESSVPEIRNSSDDHAATIPPPARLRKSVSFAADESIHIFDEPAAVSGTNDGDGTACQQSNATFPDNDGQSEILPPFRSDYMRPVVHESGDNLAKTAESSVAVADQVTTDGSIPNHNTSLPNSNYSPFPHATIDNDNSWQPESYFDENGKQLVESPVENLPLGESTLMELNIVNGDKTMHQPTSGVDGQHHCKRIKFRGTGTKYIKFGHGALESQVALASFGDIDGLQDLWAQQLSNSTSLQFDQIVLADDMVKKHTALQNERLWQGDLIPVDSVNRNSRRILDQVFEEMKTRVSGLISACPNFVILVYPKASEWEFIEASKGNPNRTRLRFIIFRCNLNIRQPVNLKPMLNPDGTAADSGPPRKALAKAIHGLRFKDILPAYHKTKQNPWNFYMMLPSTAHDLSSFLKSWIHSSCKGKIYSSHDEGSWDFFRRSSISESGVILIHQSCLNDVYRIPRFEELSKKNIAFWCISDSTSLNILSYDSWESRLGRISAKLLMPHGHAFLLTPSFLLAEPKRVCEILDWFFGNGGKHGKSDTSIPGTWKIVACHGFADYILEVARLKSMEKEAFEAENRVKPSFDQLLEDKGLDFPTCKLRWKIHEKLIQLEARHIVDLNYDSFDLNFPGEYNPIVYADPSIDPSNEKMLVEWFAAWSLRNLSQYRKFTVVGTDTRGIDYDSRMSLIQTETTLVSKESVNLRTDNSKISSDLRSSTEAPLSDNQTQTSNSGSALEKARAVAARYSLPQNKSRSPSPLKRTQTASAKGQDESPQMMDVDSTAEGVHSQAVELNMSKTPAQDPHQQSNESTATGQTGIGETQDVINRFKSTQISVEASNNAVPENIFSPQLHTGRKEYFSPYPPKTPSAPGTPSHEAEAQTVNPSLAEQQNDSLSKPMDSASLEELQGLKISIATGIQVEPTTVWYEIFKQEEGGVGYEHLFIGGWEKAFVNIGMWAHNRR